MALSIRGRRIGQGALLVTPEGVLDLSTYARLRDALLKYASDAPAAVLVGIDDLEVPSPLSLSVFATVRMRTLEWPGVPLLLIARTPGPLALLEGSTIRRFVPHFSTVAAALAGLGEPARRRRAVIRLDGTRAAIAHARSFVREVTTRWELPDVAENAQMVATELVENVLHHTLSPGTLRLELRDDTLTVAVADDSPEPAVLPDPGDRTDRISGLHLISRICRAWGNTPAAGGGKIVWVVLPAPVPGHG